MKLFLRFIRVDFTTNPRTSVPERIPASEVDRIFNDLGSLVVMLKSGREFRVCGRRDEIRFEQEV